MPHLGRPGVPLEAVKWMFQKHAPLAIRPDDKDKQFQLQWMWQMLQDCTAERYAINKTEWSGSLNTAATA